MNPAATNRVAMPVKAFLLMAGLLALPAMALAAPVAPNAGSLLRQVEPHKAPAPSKNETGLKRKQEHGGKAASTVSFEVKRIRITGNTLFDTDTLHALVRDAEGKTLDLAQLQELAKRITDYYHAHGYALSRAVLPAQTIKNGVVIIEVLEARFGKVKLDNHSRVDDSLLHDTLSPLKHGQIIGDRDMDRVLLLLSDIPGIRSTAILKPGEFVGTSDMDVEVNAAPMYAGAVQMDNYGNAYTGRARLWETLTLAEPFRHGDEFALSALTTGHDMNYAKLGYDTLLDGCGTRLGASYAILSYILGGSLSKLQGHGKAEVSSLWTRHPFIRSRDNNLYGELRYDHKVLHDHIDATSIRSDRHLDNWVGTLSGDIRDGMRGYDAWSLSLTAGRVAFDDPVASVADAATANTAGSFSKWNASYARLQDLSQRNSLYLSLAGQWTNKNLDSAEKLVAGGPYSVRAYDMGVLSGDSGYQGTLELRHRLSPQWQAKAFVDSEHITVDHSTWAAGANEATLSGGGVELDWSSHAWYVHAYVASRLGSRPTLLASASSTRGWVELGARF